MGKRGKESPMKDEKPKNNKTTRKQTVKINSNLRTSDEGAQPDPAESDILKLPKVLVVIDCKCRRLAEQALSKAVGEKTPQEEVASALESSSSSKQILPNTPKKSPQTQGKSKSTSSSQRIQQSQKLKSQIYKPEQVVSPTARRRRKALTRALKRLRKTTLHKKKEKPKERRTSLRLSSPLKSSLRARKSSVSCPKKSEKVELRSSPRKRNPGHNSSSNMNNIKENNPERARSPFDASNNSSPPSPEPDEQNEDQINNTMSSESDSDDDVQMQVLEKQVESEKEDDDGPPDVSLNLPDDTDEESLLLSPSALPASQLFRSPSSRRKKRKSLLDELSSDPTKKTETLTPFQTSTPITSPMPSYKLPTTPVSSARYMLGYPIPSISSNSGISRSEGSSLPEKRGRGRPRKALEDVKSVSGKLYRKKLAERMAAAAEEEERRAQNIYDFHIEHSDEIEPFSYPSSANPYDDLVMDPMSVAAHHQQMDEFYGDEVVGHSSSELSTDPQHMRHRLHRWGDKSTFVYAKHKFVSNENKFKCDTCQVSFTALSSLKRHYGTIYHKQQEAEGRSTLDLSDILRPDRDGRMTQAGLLSGPSSYYTSTRGRGRGRPALARTSSFVRRSAVDNIKKYYAAADAARRRRENYSTTTTTTGTTGFTSTWLQKQQRKRKPLVHSDYLYTSADSDAEDADDDDDFGCEDDINIENGTDENDTSEDNGVERPWRSNVWKGIGPPHFTCEYCGEVYTKKFEFTKHIFQHRQEEAHQLSLTCPDCLAIFPSEQLLQHHFKLFTHGVGVITHSQNDVQKITCSKCNSQFIRREYYRKHLEVHKRPLLKCPHCSKKFLYKFYLNDHMKAKHDALTNNFPNIASNNDVNVAADGLSTMTDLTNTNNNSSNAITSSVVNNIPNRPKVELYSGTTPLLTSTEINKPKDHTVSISGCSENQCDTRSDEFSSTNLSKKKISTATATLKGIPVPKFITCDLLAGHDTATRKCLGTLDGSDANNASVMIVDKYEKTLGTDLIGLSDSMNKEQVNLIQKFFDSQKEELAQNTSERDETKLDDEMNNGSSSNSNVIYPTPSGLSGIEHSTTEDGKIVFQLQHSMFKGFGTMAGGGDGEENDCNMSPLTIEIPRDNINIDIEEEPPSRVADAEANSESNNKQETCGDSEKVVISQTVPTSLDKGDNKQTEKEKPAAFDCTNSNSSVLSSAYQLLGCGAKMNPSVVVDLENELQCQDCGKTFEHKKSLIKHVRYYTQVASYPCTLCDKSFKLKHHVSRHMKSHHNIDTSSTTSSTSDDINMEDPGDLDFLNSPPGSGDSISFGGGSTLPMPSSSSSSATATGQASSAGSSKEEHEVIPFHIKNNTFHSTDKPTTILGRKRSTSDSSNKKKVDSEISSSSSFSKSNYTTVMDSNGSPVFKCLICKKLYPTKNQLNSHLWYHKRSIPYRCTTCSAEFKFKHDLNAHQLAHISEQEKFICKKCANDKTFLSRKDFLQHMREVHNYLGRKPPLGDSPAKDELAVSRCPLCPLVFPQDSDLNVHISTEHNKKDAVVCRTCGQVLGSSALLKTHMLQEHHIGEGDEDGIDDGPLKQQQHDNDDDKPPTPSPHTSPLHMIPHPEGEEEEDELEEAEPSSPEFELMEVN